MNLRNRHLLFSMTITLTIILFFVTFSQTSAQGNKQYIYDAAGILTDKEIKSLEKQAHEYSKKRKTDLIILTTDNDDTDKEIKRYIQDFYDDNKPGYDKAHGNAVILGINVSEDKRDVYLAGFKKAKSRMNDDRIDAVLDEITPHLSNDDYAKAFSLYLGLSYDYMKVVGWMNPDSIFFKTSFQLISALILGLIVVGIMLFHPGGQNTVNSNTYQDAGNTKVLKRENRYLRTTVTKVRKPKQSSNSGGGGGFGGGGGGVTRGGHSHSGGGRKF